MRVAIDVDYVIRQRNAAINFWFQYSVVPLVLPVDVLRFLDNPGQ